MIIDETPPSFWNEFDLENYTHKIPLDKNAHITLQDEWLNPSDLEERARSFARSNEIRKTFSSNKSNIYDHPSASNQPSEESTSISSIMEEPSSTSLVSKEPSSPPSNSSVLEEPSSSSSKITNESQDSSPSTSLSSRSQDTSVKTPSTPLSSRLSSDSTVSLRRSTRNNKGIRTSTDYINEVFLSSINSSFSSSHDEILAYQAELSTDLDSGIIDCADVRAYLTKAKIKDPDQPSFTEAMNGEDSERWIKAMKIEIAGLLARNTWKRVNREDILRDKNGKKYNILKSIWAFKLKDSLMVLQIVTKRDFVLEEICKRKALTILILMLQS